LLPGKPYQLWIDLPGPGRSGILPAVLHSLSAVDAFVAINLVPSPAIDDVVNMAILKSEAGRNKKENRFFSGFAHRFTEESQMTVLFRAINSRSIPCR
jgi:hypothetical protein